MIEEALQEQCYSISAHAYLIITLTPHQVPYPVPSEDSASPSDSGVHQ